MIRLYDTMTREKRPFVPLNKQRITMYVCGPTVYGRAHIGNARPAVVFDTLARLIRHEFGETSLVYARNVTDVDDKIIAAAEEEGVGYRRITGRYYKFYMEDMGALNVLPPDFEPRATRYIPRMIAMIERLIELGHAYEAQGHVLFHVPSDPDYGVLSRRDRDAILAGARVEVAPYKRDPSDFVLWKPAGGSAESVALSFDSPWGPGRPGWHIECSAMIEAFGSRQDAGYVETIDIHGGGLDLIFPHHENEIAQSRCAHQGAQLARYWVHNGFVDMGAEKMSKSLGNVITVGDLLAAGHKGETLRLALLSAHYRSPLPWTEELLVASENRLNRLYRALKIVKKKRQYRAPPELVEALCDDLNTPKALSVLSDYAEHALALRAEAASDRITIDQRSQIIRQAAIVAQHMLAGARLLGLLSESSRAYFSGRYLRNRAHLRHSRSLTKRDIETLIDERARAKSDRDFATADRIRDELKAQGVQVLDRADGKTDWERI